MVITSTNKDVIANYLAISKKFNAFVKKNFSKKEQSELSIADIIKDLHKENTQIEKLMNAYAKTNVNDYIHEGMCLKGSFSSCLIYSSNMVMIIKNISKNSKKVLIEYINLAWINYSDGRLNIEKHELTINAMDIIHHINTGQVNECSKDEYDNILTKYNEIKEKFETFNKNDI
ncbi:MAG: hypothetical protein [Wendovervirus sonii]|uniref:Uncharacterized protein n=1 Tax=phage Lak_Megaphage_Sonny TaxID=3109229 RepID=A0ABZ0Z389_9CAUD|nr:MAG: hypothetical protein [phage Lak_Megaphage_Sonny]